MTGPARLSHGGLGIDRSIEVKFTFDGKTYTGYQGDTLASALLANGVRLIGRSFKYHRPRGIYTSGPQEPNGLVTVGTGGFAVPNTPATMIAVHDGLCALSQNYWPSLKWDVYSMNSWFSGLLSAGFYYKTFMRPRRAWLFYEKFIRRAAGLGQLSGARDANDYDTRNHDCDLLIIGGGAAGLSAAYTAGSLGKSVVLCDECDQPGTWMDGLKESNGLQNKYGTWVERILKQLTAMENVMVLPRTCVFGCYGPNEYVATQRISSGHSRAQPQLLWILNPTQTIYATGAAERPLLFPRNDLPGIMTAGAARTYALQFGVSVGEQVAVATNNDSALLAALEMSRAGVNVLCVIHQGGPPQSDITRQLREQEITAYWRHTIVAVRGRSVVSGVVIKPVDSATSPATRLRCDAIVSSGGWTPSVHLASQSGVKLSYNEAIQALCPLPGSKSISIGSCRGQFNLERCIVEGELAGSGKPVEDTLESCSSEYIQGVSTSELSAPIGKADASSVFVDLQNDVTVKDLWSAIDEGYSRVEHLKRYTTLGMGTDQGKMSSVPALRLVAQRTGRDTGTLGNTTYRPPYAPVTLGAISGGLGGSLLRPERQTPLFDWHVQHSAKMEDEALWARPRFYRRSADETLDTAAHREVLQTRATVGVVDVSTFGKFEFYGPDAGEFLNRIVINNVSTIAVGRVRYCLMLREDGIPFNDGVVARLGESHYFVTSTTAQATRVESHLEFYRQVAWPSLKLAMVDVTEQWSGMALAGPESRFVLHDFLGIEAQLLDNLSPMSTIELPVSQTTLRILRVSYSGELAFELYVPASHMLWLWTTLIELGSRYSIAPYGIEALDVMRLEKGFLGGAELNGQISLQELGMEKLLRKKSFCIGRDPALARNGKEKTQRQLVGLNCRYPSGGIRIGAQVTSLADDRTSLGYVTSAAFSPSLGHPIALALIENGRARLGEDLIALSPVHDERQLVSVVDQCHFDTDGSRIGG